jgi:hypothetical protein
VRAAALLALLALLGCSARDSQRAEDGREQLVGLRADDLRLCAGVPNLTAPSLTRRRQPCTTGAQAAFCDRGRSDAAA